MFTRISISRSFTKSQWFSFSTASRGHVGCQTGTQTGGGRGTDRGRPQRQDGQQGRREATGQGMVSGPPAGAVPPSTLTLHHSPRVLPRSDQLVPHLHLLSAAHHGKGQVCLETGPRVCEHRAETDLARPSSPSSYLLEKYPWVSKQGSRLHHPPPSSSSRLFLQPLGCSGAISSSLTGRVGLALPSAPSPGRQPVHPSGFRVPAQTHPVKLKAGEAPAPAQHPVPPALAHGTQDSAGSPTPTSSPVFPGEGKAGTLRMGVARGLSGIWAGSKPPGPPALRPWPDTHIHDGINLRNSLVICGKLVDLHPIADQLAHDLDLELVELTLGDGVGLGNDGNNVHLPGPGKRGSTLVAPRLRTALPRPHPRAERQEATETEGLGGEAWPAPGHLGPLGWVVAALLTTLVPPNQPPN